MGFPTANIEIDTHYKLVPGDGIYAVTVQYESHLYGGMLYIGNRPTVDGKKKSIEVNVFDFQKEIYGELLTVNFYKLIREDIRFHDLEALKDQLYRDRETAIKVLTAQHSK
jgi:riboflavin kinase / FMN adenylyltransferase